MTSQSDAGGPGARTGAQAVDRAVSLLYALGSPAGPATLADLAARVGLPVSTTYRLAQALVRGRLITRDVHSDAYLIGPGIGELAAVAVTPQIEDVAPHLHELSASVGITASLSVTDGESVATVYSARPPVPHCERQIPEPRLGLVTSAMGQAMVAFDRRSERLRRGGHPGVLDAVRRRGHAETVTGSSDETRAIAVPVFDRGGHVTAAIGMQAASRRLTPVRVVQVLPAMRRAAVSVSETIDRHRYP